MVYGINADFGQKNIFRNACFVNPNTDNNTDIFTIAKNNKINNTDDNKKIVDNNNKYWEAAMNITDHRNAVYNQISKYTGITEYNDFPPEAKAIADKINDFCNGMTSGKLAQAKNSDDIGSEIKKCMEEVKAKQQECLEELKQLYESKNKTKSNNLKLSSDGKPEIIAEADYDDETLKRLKESPARQELSNIMQSCDDKSFSVTEKDCQKMDIITNSGIPGWRDFDEKFEKILKSNTDMVVSVIQGINQLDTKNMTEDEMKEKVNEYKGIIEKELKKMEDLRKLLDKGAEIVKEYNENKDNPELQEKIKSFEGEMNDLASISEAGINDEETQ